MTTTEDRASHAPAPDGTFAGDTAVEPIGDGRFRGDVSPRWSVMGGTPNGGYLTALAARALRHGLPHPDPVTLTTHYLAAPSPGEVVVEVELLRAGRRHSTVQGRLLQDGRDCLRLLGTFADLSQARGPDLLLREPPRLPPVDACVDVAAAARDAEVDSRFAPPVLFRFDHRVPPERLGWTAGRPSGEGTLHGWSRLVGDEPMDSLALVALVDAYPPAVFDAGGSLGWVPTIELTVQVRRRPPEGWLACHFATTAVTDGYLVEDGQVWDERGNLVALSRQLALAARPRT